MQAYQWRGLTPSSNCALLIGPRRVETAFADVKGALHGFQPARGSFLAIGGSFHRSQRPAPGVALWEFK